MEAVQPYHGNPLMALMRDARNQATHRDLLKLTNLTYTEIVYDDASNSGKYDETWWRFQTPDPSTIIVARRDTLKVLFLENEYEAIGTLGSMISAVYTILDTFERYLHGYNIPSVVHEL